MRADEWRVRGCKAGGDCSYHEMETMVDYLYSTDAWRVEADTVSWYYQLPCRINQDGIIPAASCR